ncbi:unnamed protein product [Ceratitis capitata]|uniref:(Mediterranean fruit fly) hypothetical protein n=1 Tax=Ceratitis capitata TaxID=7213 RepID=A0A811UHD4_CERCA|nr:unnamed protein product [Ceratitis capitata]
MLSLGVLTEQKEDRADSAQHTGVKRLPQCQHLQTFDRPAEQCALLVVHHPSCLVVVFQNERFRKFS